MQRTLPEPSWWARRARDLRAGSHYLPRQVLRRGLVLLRRRITGAAPSGLRRRLAALRAAPPPCRSIAPNDGLRAFLLDPGVNPPERAESLLSGRFEFVGLTREFGAPPRWNDRSGAPSHLWRMNLHYHRFLVDAAAESARRPERAHVLLGRAADWLDDWTGACLPGDPAGWSDAWNSYAASTRLLHAWCARRLLEGVAGAAAEALRRRLDGLGASSASFVEAWLERDLGGNHLLRNAFALLAAGRWFTGPLASRWERVGRRVVEEELARQLLPDGCHDERSPMYHALQLEDLLLAALASGPVPGDEPLREQASKLLAAFGAMLHADGEIALLNDSAFGIAAPARALRSLAEDAGIAPATLPSGELPFAGYYRFAGEGSVLLFDAGSLGPDHLPAHAHCDALSFDWSVAGRRVVTDTGVDRYEAGPERDFQRGVAAHATLQAAERDQGEPFGGFRMGRRPRVTGRRTGPDVVEGQHDGFGRHGIHARRVTVGPESIRWTDRLVGPSDCPVTVRVGFTPDASVSLERAGAVVAFEGGVVLRMSLPDDGAAAVESGIQCERFGSAVSRPVLAWRGVGGRGRHHAFELARVR
ncbi:MAG TPA: alginate lyase family protein [Candidatus Polarisedimenticolaceae bacterium]